MSHEDGITADSLQGIYREAYLNAIEAAREEHDPADDWDGFREYLWRALVPAFGLDDTGPGEAGPGGTDQQQSS